MIHDLATAFLVGLVFGVVFALFNAVFQGLAREA